MAIQNIKQTVVDSASAASAKITAAGASMKDGAVSVGVKVRNGAASIGGKIRDVVVGAKDSAVEATTVKPETSVADLILSKAALSLGPAKPAEDASLVKKALATPFHYADQASVAVGKGIMHTTKAVQKTLDTVISSVATTIAMVVKAVAFVVTAVALPVIAAIGAAVGIAVSPFAASGVIVGHKKNKEIAKLTEELAAAKRTPIVKAQEALQKATETVKANAPSKATAAKAAAALTVGALAAAAVSGKLNIRENLAVARMALPLVGKAASDIVRSEVAGIIAGGSSLVSKLQSMPSKLPSIPYATSVVEGGKRVLQKLGLIDNRVEFNPPGLNTAVGQASAALLGKALQIMGPVPKAPAVQAPAVETPAAVEAPAVQAPAVETPAAVEAPAVQAPAVETPAEAPAAEAPAVEAPAVEAPAVEAPAVEAPAVKAPAVEAPAVEAPAVEAPAVEAPAVEAPAAEAPAAEQNGE